MTEQPNWARTLNQIAADLKEGLTHAGNVLAAQAAMGWAFRGDLVNTRAALAGMTPEQLRELSAAASLLAAVADEALSGETENGGDQRPEEGQPVEEWERGPDAASGVGEPPARVEGRMLLLYGDFAVVVTAYHPEGDPLHVPAAGLAEQLGIDVEELPGRRFTAAIVGDRVMGAELTG
ncbi:hypothetical protein [Nonomuraea angiospora]|uniref:hypothetical protein n=1 Tax=Nonomuraea angiospora TaxID=46172 RepID=UPI0029A9F269|nr:hypothetical protein [Nonomuraea angiospora]MDX3100466.1 hypothetical protein [Nonomuraea angiospora]